MSVYETTAPLGEAADGDIHSLCTLWASMVLAACLTVMSTVPIKGDRRSPPPPTACKNSMTLCLASRAMAVASKPRTSEAESVEIMVSVGNT